MAKPIRRAGLAVTAGAIALAACTTAAPTPISGPATPAPQTPVLGPPGIPPGVASPTPAAPPPAGAAAALALAETAYSGQEREDALSMLREAERLGDQAARYRAYQGAWYHLHGVYQDQGRPPAQKAVLDAIEAIARTFPQYDPAQFPKS
jgi:hypothetical protein